MFSDFLIGVFLSFFAIYGLVQTIINIFSYIGDKKIFKNKTVYTVVAVKNAEDEIEGIVNALLLKVLKDDNGAYDHKVSIIDLGSTDRTIDMLNLIKRDKSNLNIYNETEFLNEIRTSWKNM